MGKREVTPLHRGGRVGDDGGEVVGEDCGDDDGPRWHSGATGSEGDRGPFFFFLDLLPRWEKGFPSGPWPPWRGRGESPSEIGSVSLSLSVSSFSNLAFHCFFYIRRSVTPIGVNLSPRFFS